MITTLAPGAISVRPSSFQDGLDMAKRHDFAGIEINPMDLPEDAADRFAAAGVVPATFGVPFGWSGDPEGYAAGLAKFPTVVANAASVGCRRCATWVMPASDDFAFDANVVFHVERLKPLADILGEAGMQLGLEFIGTKTLRDRFQHPFIYTLEGMLELGEKIGPNVGLLLDAWHWYTSEGTVDSLNALRPEQVVYVHVNDAPAGVPIHEQRDNVRTLPGVTGVIEIAPFIQALRTIGYDGPVAVEPFDEGLKALPDDDTRLSHVRESLRAIGL